MKLNKFINTIKTILQKHKSSSPLWEDSESDSYDKNDMKENASELVRLHETMQEKLKTESYS